MQLLQKNNRIKEELFESDKKKLQKHISELYF